MSDLIDRQAAIDALGERPMVWMDSDYEIAQRNQWDVDKLAIETVPSAADVVEVVRCKDCKHRDAENGFCEGRGWPMQLVPDDGFCDKGHPNCGADMR